MTTKSHILTLCLLITSIMSTQAHSFSNAWTSLIQSPLSTASIVGLTANTIYKSYNTNKETPWNLQPKNMVKKMPFTLSCFASISLIAYSFEKNSFRYSWWKNCAILSSITAQAIYEYDNYNHRKAIIVPQLINDPNITNRLFDAIKNKRPLSEEEPLLNTINNPNAINNVGLSLLSWAILFKQSEIAIKLIEKGADIHKRNNPWESALSCAVALNNYEVVKNLLSMEQMLMLKPMINGLHSCFLILKK